MATKALDLDLQVTQALRALPDIQWMARRQASVVHRQTGGQSVATAVACDEATWLLARLRSVRDWATALRPDPTANRDFRAEDPAAVGGSVEQPSVFTDGAPVDFAPTADRQAELLGLTDAAAVQWIVDVLHPLAHRYADGRSTYATSDFNRATRVLRTSGLSLAVTEALGRSVWVSDGMGDGCSGLTAAEIRERDLALVG